VISYGGASPLCGLTDNNIRYPSTTANYNADLRPAKGQTYVDSIFGCTVKRISDGPTDLNRPALHDYGPVTPFNSNNTRILLHNSGGYFVSDLNGNIVISPSSLGIVTSQEARWSRSNPNFFYYHSGNSLRRYDISSQSSVALRTFTEYSTINFCGGSTDLSEDGDHIAICGDGTTVFAYRISTNTKFPAVTFANVGDAEMTPNNNVAVGSNTDWKLYDINMNFIRQIAPFIGHNDIGRDLNGDEIMVIVASNDPSRPPGCENNGVEKIRLSDSAETCLLPLYWGETTHMGISNDGWVIVSNTDASTRGTSYPPASLPGDWQSQWGTYFNELTLVKLDGSQKRRLAHHRSRRCTTGLPCYGIGYDPYWSTPRASISSDGKYVVFDSNHAQDPFPTRPDYGDVYLIQVKP
jgi:hypothetical protein